MTQQALFEVGMFPSLVIAALLLALAYALQYQRAHTVLAYLPPPPPVRKNDETYETVASATAKSDDQEKEITIKVEQMRRMLDSGVVPGICIFFAIFDIALGVISALWYANHP